MKGRHERNSPNPDQGLARRIGLGALRVLGGVTPRRTPGEGVREAVDYSEAAAKITDTERDERGMLYARAGQAYMGADQHDMALGMFERAQADLEVGILARPTQEVYTSLAKTYQGIEFTCLELGRIPQAWEVHDRAVELAEEMRQLFGLETDFYEGGMRITRMEGTY
ncbi:MAG TPA: hypothetical protein VFC50_01565 [Candidatus Dormibacteraeota bacterium]|nr:hypothetical protein [Candidatus Dormibacteraeota bacterium]